MSHAPSQPTDLISELLTGMRLHGVQYRRIQTGPTFGLGFPPKPGHAYFHYLAVGTAILRGADGSQHRLSAGDVVLLPRGDEHALLSGDEHPVQCLETIDAAPLGDAVSGIDTCPSTHAVPSAVLFHGCMVFDLGGMQGLSKVMPAVMLADGNGTQFPGLLPMVDAMKREVCSGRIGYAGILSRLADAVAAMIVRDWVERGCDGASGLVMAMRDPRLSLSLLALHRDPGRDWTVEALAAESNISRSVFADRFQTVIGTAPLRYVTELRMQLASQWLTHQSLPIEVVADRLGYASQAAFSRAYKRVIGHSPGATRRGRALAST